MGNLVFRIAISLFLNSCISSPNMSNDAKNSETISTEIQIENKRGLKPLTGILTRPKTFEPNLLILFQSGSGRGSLDDSSRPYNPVREFLEEASTKGIASLRYDKRGTGLNSDAGDHDQQTLNNYESDALDAFDSIASKGIVKEDKIVSMGHSLGGLFAIKVAQQRPNAGLILSATPSGTALEFMTEQQVLLATFLNPTNPEKARASVNEYMLPYNNIKNNSFKFEDCPNSRCLPKKNHQTLDDQNLIFWKELMKIDIALEIKKLKGGQKIFCIGGGFDWVISPHHAARNCQGVPNRSLESQFKVIQNLDHFFAVTQSVDESISRFVARDLTLFRSNHEYNHQILLWMDKLR